MTQQYNEHCTHCGMCIEVCPMYSEIDLIDELCSYLDGNCEQVTSEDIFRCLTCGLCVQACPEDLSLKKLITTARANWVKTHSMREEHTIVDPCSGNNLFVAMSKISEHAVFPEDKDEGAVVYYPGCSAGYINTNIAAATINILDRVGVDYTVLSGVSHCCGAVSAGSGNKGLMEEMGRKNVAEVKRRGVKTLITSCPGCYRAFADMYPGVLGELGFEVLQMSQYLKRLIDEKRIVPQQALEHSVFYQDPCHLTRSVGIYEEPRDVISSMPGTRLVNDSLSHEGSKCCGFGGSVRAMFPSESVKLASLQIETAKDMECDVIVTNCPGCMQNLVEAGMNYGDDDDDDSIMVYDLTEYVSMSLGFAVVRNDIDMIDSVNKAYCNVITGYCKPEI
ncbi:MAG: (Fe-S)-binding protein [Methanosarcinaceae archaeon]|nr:(Fe-S)-binding protein [Methanosarcinaceae archaeon]